MEEHGNDLVFCFPFHRDKLLKRCRLLCSVEEHRNDFVFYFLFLFIVKRYLNYLCYPFTAGAWSKGTLIPAVVVVALELL